MTKSRSDLDPIPYYFGTDTAPKMPRAVRKPNKIERVINDGDNTQGPIWSLKRIVYREVITPTKLSILILLERGWFVGAHGQLMRQGFTDFIKIPQGHAVGPSPWDHETIRISVNPGDLSDMVSTGLLDLMIPRMPCAARPTYTLTEFGHDVLRRVHRPIMEQATALAVNAVWRGIERRRRIRSERRAKRARCDAFIRGEAVNLHPGDLQWIAAMPGGREAIDRRREVNGERLYI